MNARFLASGSETSIADNRIHHFSLSSKESLLTSFRRWLEISCSHIEARLSNGRNQLWISRSEIGKFLDLKEHQMLLPVSSNAHAISPA
jgi:hypothetical protein